MSWNLISLSPHQHDDHRPGAANDERPHGEQDPVALVRRSLGRPQRLRYDTEHRAAVEAEKPSFTEISSRPVEARNVRCARLVPVLQCRCGWLLQLDQDS